MILTALRERTAALHDRVERAVDLPARLRSREAYANLLARFYGFYAPVEARLAAVGGYDAVGLNLEPRRKAGRLRADLHALGLAADGLPQCAALPAVGDLPAALGCLYVLEGATLGGQYVRREVTRAYGLGPETGCSFFASYQGRVREMWADFCAALTAYAAAHPAAHGPIVAAAADTFARMEDWLA